MPKTLRDLLWDYHHSKQQIDEAFARLADLQTQHEEAGKAVRHELKKLPAGTVVEAHGTAYRLNGMNIETFPYLDCWSIPVGQETAETNILSDDDCGTATYRVPLYDDHNELAGVREGVS